MWDLIWHGPCLIHALSMITLFSCNMCTFLVCNFDFKVFLLINYVLNMERAAFKIKQVTYYLIFLNVRKKILCGQFHNGGEERQAISDKLRTQ